MKLSDLMNKIIDEFNEYDVGQIPVYRIDGDDCEIEDSFDNHLIIIRHNNYSFTLGLEGVFSVKIDFKGYGYMSHNNIVDTAIFIFAAVGFAKTIADISWTENNRYDGCYQNKNDILIKCFVAAISRNHINAAKCIMFTDWRELSDQKQSTLTGLHAEWFGIHNRFNNWLINQKLNDHIDLYLHDIPPVSVECKALMLKWKHEHTEFESEDMEL